MPHPANDYPLNLRRPPTSINCRQISRRNTLLNSTTPQSPVVGPSATKGTTRDRDGIEDAPRVGCRRPFVLQTRDVFSASALDGRLLLCFHQQSWTTVPSGVRSGRPETDRSDWSRVSPGADCQTRKSRQLASGAY